MKLRIGDFLIETDHIEMIEWLSEYNVKIFFVSGRTLDVVCGIQTTSSAFWNQTAEEFIQTIHNTDFTKLNATLSKDKK